MFLLPHVSFNVFLSHHGYRTDKGWQACSCPSAPALRRYISGLVSSAGVTDVLVYDKEVGKSLGPKVMEVPVTCTSHFRCWFSDAKDVISLLCKAVGKSEEWALATLNHHHLLVRNFSRVFDVVSL